MRFRGDIEGLRALAVVVVVLFHCGVPGFGGGYVGVDVFFVLSGFLITTLMLAEVGRTSRLSLPAFYGRRARRLLPAAVMVIAVTTIVGWLVLDPLTRRDLVGDAISATTYTVNWRFALRSTDYFQAELDPSALQHYWSLAVEEQFYIVWPLVIGLLAGARVARGRLAAGISAVVLVSFGASVVITARSQPWAFFGTHTRMWQLGSGALLAVVWPHVGRLPATARRIAPILGLLAVCAAVAVFDEATRWPGTAALLPTLGTLAVLVGADDGPVANVLRTPPALWVGARSYSWYLWHWPALILFAAWRGTALSPAAGVVVALGALAVAHVGYTVVEQRVRYAGPIARSPRRSLSVGLGLSAACLLGLLALRATGGEVAATGPAGTAGEVPDAETLPSVLEAAAATTAVPANLRPALDEARDDLPEVYQQGCHADIPDTQPIVCELGDPTGAVTVVVIGDSHAAQWTPALTDLAGEAGIRLIPLTKSGCAAFDVPVFNSTLNRVYTECDEWRANVVDLVGSLRPDQVIVTQSSFFTPADTDPDDADDVILEAYVRTLDVLARSSGSVVVLSDTPYPADDVPACLAGHLDAATACTTGREQAFAHRRTAVEEEATARSGAAYVAVDDLVCGPTRCPVVVGDLLVYRDNSHLTTPYVRWIAPLLASSLGPRWTDGP